MTAVCLHPGRLTLAELRTIAFSDSRLELEPACVPVVARGAATVAAIARSGEPAYGINTGFGRLAQTHIPDDQLELLQKNLVLSHAVGVGEPLSVPTVRLVLALKIASLARGHSGVRMELINALLGLFNAGVVPRVPSKGSVGGRRAPAPPAPPTRAAGGRGRARPGRAPAGRPRARAARAAISRRARTFRRCCWASARLTSEADTCPRPRLWRSRDSRR